MSAGDIGAGDPLTPVTVGELAKLLGVAPKTVYGMAARREIPGALHVGRLLRFARPAVVAWLSGGQPTRRSK